MTECGDEATERSGSARAMKLLNVRPSREAAQRAADRVELHVLFLGIESSQFLRSSDYPQFINDIEKAKTKWSQEEFVSNAIVSNQRSSLPELVFSMYAKWYLRPRQSKVRLSRLQFSQTDVPLMKLARLSLYVMAVVFLGLGAMSLVAPTKTGKSDAVHCKACDRADHQMICRR